LGNGSGSSPGGYFTIKALYYPLPKLIIDNTTKDTILSFIPPPTTPNGYSNMGTTSSSFSSTTPLKSPNPNPNPNPTTPGTPYSPNLFETLGRTPSLSETMADISAWGLRGSGGGGGGGSTVTTPVLPPAGALMVRIHEARDLLHMDYNGYSDPFAVVYYGDREVMRTKVREEEVVVGGGGGGVAVVVAVAIPLQTSINPHPPPPSSSLLL